MNHQKSHEIVTYGFLLNVSLETLYSTNLSTVFCLAVRFFFKLRMAYYPVQPQVLFIIAKTKSVTVTHHVPVHTPGNHKNAITPRWMKLPPNGDCRHIGIGQKKIEQNKLDIMSRCRQYEGNPEHCCKAKFWKEILENAYGQNACTQFNAQLGNVCIFDCFCSVKKQ